MAGVAPLCYDWVYPEIEVVPGSLKGKVALVTGASQGIGRSIALAFAQAGASVALLARTEATLKEVEGEIKAAYPDVKTAVVPADAASEEQVEAAFKKTEAELGSVDILINNAAINLFKPVVKMTSADWARSIAINLQHPIFLTSLALEGMRARNSGTIVNVASRAGTVSVPFATAYSATKAALIRATSCTQLELLAEGKTGISMFSLHPGGVKTAMTLNSLDPSLEEIAPGTIERVTKFYHEHANTEPEQCAATCVYLARGKADVLKGAYFDVGHDLGQIVQQADIVKKEGMYGLRVNFLGGAPDDGALDRKVPKPTTSGKA